MVNKREVWDEKIYPRIKKNLLAVIIASLEDTDLEMNTFELNGADFLIGFDYDPILLEINANPDLTSTTRTTRDICPRVMEDLVKGETRTNQLTEMSILNLFHTSLSVILDHNNDQSASTGDFELIYECPIGRYYPPQKIQLNVDGKKISPPSKPQRNFFHIKNFSDLIVHGETLFKPIKPRIQTNKVPMEMKAINAETLLEKQAPIKRIAEKYRRIKPRKLYRSPQRPRNIFEAIVVKPSCSDDVTSYVRKLPSILQSTNRKFVNLNDLMRYLKINENFL